MKKISLDRILLVITYLLTIGIGLFIYGDYLYETTTQSSLIGINAVQIYNNNGHITANWVIISAFILPFVVVQVIFLFYVLVNKKTFWKALLAIGLVFAFAYSIVIFASGNTYVYSVIDGEKVYLYDSYRLGYGSVCAIILSSIGILFSSGIAINQMRRLG